MYKLEKMLEMQSELQAFLGYDFSSMSDEEKAAYVKEYTVHCVHELHEVLQDTPGFKAWKKTTVYDFTRCKEELIDAWHFFMNVMLALGMTPDELLSEYLKKNQENYLRQRNTATYKHCVEVPNEAGD